MLARENFHTRATRALPLVDGRFKFEHRWRFAILLDVDGTIIDVAATPQSVVVPTSLVRTLGELLARTVSIVVYDDHSNRVPSDQF